MIVSPKLLLGGGIIGLLGWLTMVGTIRWLARSRNLLLAVPKFIIGLAWVLRVPKVSKFIIGLARVLGSHRIQNRCDVSGPPLLGWKII